MNNYARLSHVKDRVTGMVGAGSILDSVYLQDVEAESRDFERRCGGRIFYTKEETRYGWAPGWLYGIDPATGCQTTRIVSLPFDVISLTTLKVDLDDDGTFETTLVDGTDYRLGPDNSVWKRHIELLRNSTQVSGWLQRSRFAELVGKFGHSEEWEALSITGTVASTDGTTVTASDSATGLIDAGDTIKLGDEQLYVSASEGTSVTVVRGVNGSTAATHSTDTIYVRRYPRDIERIIRDRVVQRRIDNNQLMPMGERGAEFAEYMAVVNSYTLVAVG